MLRSKKMIAAIIAMLFVALLGTSAFADHVGGNPSGVTRQAPLFTPTLDGTISAAEMSSMMTYTLQFPESDSDFTGNCISGCGGGFPTHAEFSADFYVSWDNNNLYVAADVLDNSPFYAGGGGNNTGSLNAQDTVQMVLGGGDTNIWDITLDTPLTSGPDIFRNAPGPAFSAAEYASLKDNVEGTSTAGGYMLEAALPWPLAANDPGYSPSVGDVRGLSFLVVSKPSGGSGFDGLSLDTFAWGEWNHVELIPEPTSFGLLGLGSLVVGGSMLRLRRRRR